MSIKWTHSAVNDLTDIVLKLEDKGQPYYAQKIEKRVLSKIKLLADDATAGFHSFCVDMCKVDYRVADKDLRVLKVSSVRPI